MYWSASFCYPPVATVSLFFPLGDDDFLYGNVAHGILKGSGGYYKKKEKITRMLTMTRRFHHIFVNFGTGARGAGGYNK